MNGSFRYFLSAATRAVTILSGLETVPLFASDPFFNLSTFSIPDVTCPITVYCPFRLGVEPNMMKNWLFAEFGLELRAMPTMPRVNGVDENSAGKFGYFEPPVPLPYWPSPVCAMKLSITRWNGTLL